MSDLEVLESVWNTHAIARSLLICVLLRMRSVGTYEESIFACCERVQGLLAGTDTILSIEWSADVTVGGENDY